MMPQRGHQLSSRTKKPNQVPDPNNSRTVAILASANANPSDIPTASAIATRNPCFEAQISQRDIIRQLTMISGT